MADRDLEEDTPTVQPKVEYCQQNTADENTTLFLREELEGLQVMVMEGLTVEEVEHKVERMVVEHHQQDWVEMTEQVEIPLDQTGMENSSQQFLDYEEVVFNPDTGLIEPMMMAAVTSVSTTPPSPPKQVENEGEPSISTEQKVFTTEFQETGEDVGERQPIIMDPNHLMGYINSGGKATLSLDGQEILLLPEEQPVPSVPKESLTNTTPPPSDLKLFPQDASDILDLIRPILVPQGVGAWKTCNCAKTKCLKLYCPCFANGQFCHLCNCLHCSNNLAHEKDRQIAMHKILTKKPYAFKPKIGKSSQTSEAHARAHHQGCKCSRSGCLKSYCECYEAKVFCSELCKCKGCRNNGDAVTSVLPPADNIVEVETHFGGSDIPQHRQTLKETAEIRVQQQQEIHVVNTVEVEMQEVPAQNHLGRMVPPVVFRDSKRAVSSEVVSATVEVLLAKAKACEEEGLSEGEIEGRILEEFGDCLAAIMELESDVERSKEDHVYI